MSSESQPDSISFECGRTLSTRREQNASSYEACILCNSMHQMYTLRHTDTQPHMHIHCSPVPGKQVKFKLVLEQELLLAMLMRVTFRWGYAGGIDLGNEKPWPSSY